MLQNDLCLASKPRYEILDGLRGVAAMMVIVFHCFETYIPLIGTQIINHGYLAVDFFFILSGFVIGYAYNDRWNSMTTSLNVVWCVFIPWLWQERYGVLPFSFLQQAIISLQLFKRRYGNSGFALCLHC